MPKTEANPTTPASGRKARTRALGGRRGAGRGGVVAGGGGRVPQGVGPPCGERESPSPGHSSLRGEGESLTPDLSPAGERESPSPQPSSLRGEGESLTPTLSPVGR